jgi:hypothetical protein
LVDDVVRVSDEQVGDGDGFKDIVVHERRRGLEEDLIFRLSRRVVEGEMQTARPLGRGVPVCVGELVFVDLRAVLGVRVALVEIVVDELLPLLLENLVEDGGSEVGAACHRLVVEESEHGQGRAERVDAHHMHADHAAPEGVLLLGVARPMRQRGLALVEAVEGDGPQVVGVGDRLRLLGVEKLALLVGFVEMVRQLELQQLAFDGGDATLLQLLRQLVTRVAATDAFLLGEDDAHLAVPVQMVHDAQQRRLADARSALPARSVLSRRQRHALVGEFALGGDAVLQIRVERSEQLCHAVLRQSVDRVGHGGGAGGGRIVLSVLVAVIEQQRTHDLGFRFVAVLVHGRLGSGLGEADEAREERLRGVRHSRLLQRAHVDLHVETLLVREERGATDPQHGAEARVADAPAIPCHQRLRAYALDAGRLYGAALQRVRHVLGERRLAGLRISNGDALRHQLLHRARAVLATSADRHATEECHDARFVAVSAAALAVLVEVLVDLDGGGPQRLPIRAHQLRIFLR